MTTTMMANDRPKLGIHVFGGKKGESIIVELPDQKWGVVDCYANSLKNVDTNHTIQFLRREHPEVDELEFLCLTHPHDDHYRGMSQILAEFKVKSFWQFGALAGKQLASLIYFFRVEAERAHRTDSELHESVSRENASEFDRIVQLANIAHREKRLKWKFVTSNKLLYTSHDSEIAPLHIYGIAPGDNEVKKYQDSFAKCFVETDRISDTHRPANHNSVSVALKIEFGETRVVLGGDVECMGWDDVMDDCGVDGLQSCGVKVSHHGSTNGYNERLWHAFSNGPRKPVAIVTPFSRFHLPAATAIEHIQPFVSRLVSPSKDACLWSMKRPRYRHTMSGRKAASRRELAKAMTLSKPPPSSDRGSCSVYFDDAGRSYEEIGFDGAGDYIPS